MKDVFVLEQGSSFAFIVVGVVRVDNYVVQVHLTRERKKKTIVHQEGAIEYFVS